MKRFQTAKGFLLGVAICSLISVLLTSAYAASTAKQLTAHFNDIKIVINGEKLDITMEDLAGNAVEPFTVDGRTYLPLKVVAEAFGYLATWDDATKTVYMYLEDDNADNSSDSTQTQTEASVWLKDMSPLVNDWVYTPLNRACRRKA